MKYSDNVSSHLSVRGVGSLSLPFSDLSIVSCTAVWNNPFTARCFLEDTTALLIQDLKTLWLPARVKNTSLNTLGLIHEMQGISV